MTVTKNTRRVFVFNIIMAIIGCSRGLECVEKVVYTNTEGQKTTKESDEPMKCEDTEPFCITASGSFDVDDDEYEVESLQRCSHQNYCEALDAAKALALLVKQIDSGIPFESYYDFKAGKTPITTECCQEDNCNKSQKTTSSSYSIHKISFTNIVLFFAVSGIFFL